MKIRVKIKTVYPFTVVYIVKVDIASKQENMYSVAVTVGCNYIVQNWVFNVIPYVVLLLPLVDLWIALWGAHGLDGCSIKAHMPPVGEGSSNCSWMFGRKAHAIRFCLGCNFILLTQYLCFHCFFHCSFSLCLLVKMRLKIWLNITWIIALYSTQTSTINFRSSYIQVRES